MAKTFAIKVDGVVNLDRNLRQLIPKLGQKKLGTANYAGAAPMRDAVRQEAPYLSGNLKKAIIIVKRKQTSRTQATHVITIRQNKKRHKANNEKNRVAGVVGQEYQSKGDDAYYAKFVERGHYDRAGKWQEANPFMRRAFMATTEDSIRHIGWALSDDIDEIASEMRKT